VTTILDDEEDKSRCKIYPLSRRLSTPPPRKTEKPRGRDGRARLSSAVPRARESTRRDFRLSRVAQPLRLSSSRATGPPHFCVGRRKIIFIIVPQHTTKEIERGKKQKKTKSKATTYLLDGWVFERFRRFRARAFRLRGIRSRRLGDDFRGGGSNGVHDCVLFIAFL